MPTPPKIGDIVLYVHQGEHYPGLVVKVHDPDNAESAIALAYFTPEPASRGRVDYSPAPESGHWSWREPPTLPAA